MKDIDKAIEILNNDGIIIYPTDTAYGIGCRMDSEKAVEKVFKIRKRPENMAMPVLVDSIKMACHYLVNPVSSEVIGFMKKYWPGALTIVYKCNTEKVPTRVRGGGSSLGVRMPKHEKILRIIEKIGVPILGSSANFHKDTTPFSSNDLNGELISLVDYVVYGETRSNKASTVIDCCSDECKILRQGSVYIDEDNTDNKK
jgi:L-threonylcarbamoyladenylate synthase